MTDEEILDRLDALRAATQAASQANRAAAAEANRLKGEIDTQLPRIEAARQRLVKLDEQLSQIASQKASVGNGDITDDLNASHAPGSLKDERARLGTAIDKKLDALPDKEKHGDGTLENELKKLTDKLAALKTPPPKKLYQKILGYPTSVACVNMSFTVASASLTALSVGATGLDVSFAFGMALLVGVTDLISTCEDTICTGMDYEAIAAQKDAANLHIEDEIKENAETVSKKEIDGVRSETESVKDEKSGSKLNV